jgi:hypothetical protein
MAFKTHTVGVAALALSWLLAATTFATEGESLPFDEPVVPPGQDELISTMLGRGAALPDGCTFGGGVSNGPLISSTYHCPSGKVVFRIVHPDNATESATQTERFAIMIDSGAPPTTLTEALASLFRSNESDFEWLWLTSEDEETEAEEDALQ